MDNKNPLIQYGIRGIEDREFAIDESMELRDPCKFTFSAQIHTKIPDDSIHIAVSVKFFTEDPDSPLMHGTVVTSFFVRNLKQYSRKQAGEDVTDLPLEFWVTLFSLSFTHTRAIMAKDAKETKFSSLILPVIKPDQAFKKIFKNEMTRFSSAKLNS